MSENDFFSRMLDAISDLRTDTATTNAELRAVAARMDVHATALTEHQQAIGKLQVEIAERRLACPLVASVEDDLVQHKLECPLRARMDAVEDFISVTRAMAVSNKHWLDRMWPFIYASGRRVLAQGAIWNSGIEACPGRCSWLLDLVLGPCCGHALPLHI